MKIKVQVIVESNSGEAELVQEVAQLERGEVRAEEIGLSLAEAKALLQNVQQAIVERQCAAYLEQQSSCPECGKRRLHKGEHTIVYRTLKGRTAAAQSPPL